MSSYDPPEESEDGSSYDPGVKERAVSEQREFPEVVADLDRSDYIVFAMMLGIPAAIVAGFLLVLLFPEQYETVGEVVRRVGEWVADYLGR